MFKMIEVEKYECNDKREAKRRENEVMKELKATMNSYRPHRTMKQYREDNTEKNKETNNQYRDNNKDIINEKKRIYDTLS